jgi:hypothetical protein
MADVDQKEAILARRDIGDPIADNQLPHMAQPAKLGDHLRVLWVAQLRHMQRPAGNHVQVRPGNGGIKRRAHAERARQGKFLPIRRG